MVELEKDLSIKKQLLDVVILRRRKGRFNRPLPDGLDSLAEHNLITFKSHHEALDDWALKELTGHYVNYRKQVRPSMQSLLPEEDFRLYAVCSRFPSHLADGLELRPLQGGVFECRRGTDLIHVVVANELPLRENNALLHLLAAAPEKISFGVANYQQHSDETSSLLKDLFLGYEREGLVMSYTLDDYRREKTLEHLKELTAKERLQGLSLEERLQGVPAEEIEEYLKRHKPENEPRKRKRKK